MRKTLKVRKMINQNGLQVDNYTMVLRLKKIIQQLNMKIHLQDQQIMQLKRDTKTTKIYQMQVQIQHLNDQNKRLVIMIDEMKHTHKHERAMMMKNNSFFVHSNSNNNVSDNCKQLLSQSDNNKTDSKSIFINNSNVTNSNNNNEKKFITQGIRSHTIKKKKKSPNSMLFTSGGMMSSTVGYSFNNMSMANINNSHNNNKKSYPEVQRQKQQLMKQQLKEKKFQKKYFQLLEETQKLKKQLINIKMNQTQLQQSSTTTAMTATKKAKSSFNNTMNNNNNYTHGQFGDNIKTAHLLFIEKNIQSLEKMTQKKNDLQVENDILKNKLTNFEKKMKQFQKENQEIKAVLVELQGEIKRRNLMNSDKRLNKKIPTLFMDLSNNNVMENV